MTQCITQDFLAPFGATFVFSAEQFVFEGMPGEEAVYAWTAPPFERVDFEMGLQFGPEAETAEDRPIAREAWTEDDLCPFADGGVDGWLLGR